MSILPGNWGLCDGVGSTLCGWWDKDGANTKDEPDLEGVFVSLQRVTTRMGPTLSHFSASRRGAILSKILVII